MTADREATDSEESNAHRLPDLASRALGASVVYANDELFAERENLIKPEPPVFAAHTFGHKGQLMDGWETRRRRDLRTDAGSDPGSDHAIVRLGCAGIIRHVVIDTAFFTGNYPPEVSLEACGAEGYPSPSELAAAEWTSIVARSPVAGDSANKFEVRAPERFTHVRLTIFPDGGVARLRVHGEIVPDPRLLPTTFDLAALDNGALVTDCSNMFYSSPSNLIMPGNARTMGEGWETSRRRDNGNDWVTVRLACTGRVELAELDTSNFTGNAPSWSALTGAADVALLERTALQPDTRHRFALATDAAVGRVRLDVYPDGGMARLRLFGTPSTDARTQLARRFSASLPESQLVAVLARLGIPPDQAGRLASTRPFDLETLPRAARDWLCGIRTG